MEVWSDWYSPPNVMCQLEAERIKDIDEKNLQYARQNILQNQLKSRIRPLLTTPTDLLISLDKLGLHRYPVLRLRSQDLLLWFPWQDWLHSMQSSVLFIQIRPLSIRYREIPPATFRLYRCRRGDGDARRRSCVCVADDRWELAPEDQMSVVYQHARQIKQRWCFSRETQVRGDWKLRCAGTDSRRKDKTLGNCMELGKL